MFTNLATSRGCHPHCSPRLSMKRLQMFALASGSDKHWHVILNHRRAAYFEAARALHIQGFVLRISAELEKADKLVPRATMWSSTMMHTSAAGRQLYRNVAGRSSQQRDWLELLQPKQTSAEQKQHLTEMNITKCSILSRNFRKQWESFAKTKIGKM